MLGPWRWMHLDMLFDDWIFARDYVRSGNANLEKRLDNIARELVAAARSSGADEIVVVGHSLGAALAVNLLDRALELEPALGARALPIHSLSAGPSFSM